MARPTYNVIEHTADIGIEVHEPTLEALFATAAFALFDLQIKTDKVRPTESVEVEATGGDLVELLVAWLSELQFQFETKKLVFAEFNVREVTESRARVTCRGERYERRRHGSLALVKAVTYHQATVEPRDGGWYARLIFDV